MNVTRGEIWTAELDPTQGSEQAGRRPVLVLQNDAVNRFTTTVLAIPADHKPPSSGLALMCLGCSR